LFYKPEELKKVVRVKMEYKPSHRKLSLIVRLLDKVYGFLTWDTCATKRELFYQFMLSDQAILDSCVVRISNFLEAAPWEFGIMSTSKGIVAGDLSITFPGAVTLDCKRGTFFLS